MIESMFDLSDEYLLHQYIGRHRGRIWGSVERFPLPVIEW